MNDQTNQLSNPGPGATTPAAKKAGARAGATLRRKLVLTFIVMALIPLSLIAYWRYSGTRQAIIDTVNQSLQARATIAAADIDTFAQLNLRAIKAEAGMSQIRGYLELPADWRRGSPEERLLQETLQALQATKGETGLVSYAVLNTVGINLLDTDPANIGQVENRYAYFYKAALSSQPYAGLEALSNDAQTSALHFSSRIIGPDGGPIGVLRLRYQPGALQFLVQSNIRTSNASVVGMVFDDQGNYLAHSDQQDLVGQAANIPGLQQHLRSVLIKPLFTLQLGSGPDSMALAAAANPKTQPWSVVFVRNEKEVLQDIRAEALVTGLIWGAAVLLLLFGASSAADLLTTPLRRLVAASQQVAAGATGIRVPVQSEDEVGQLAQTFNRVADQLQEVMSRTEKQVADRTRGLESMVKSLETGNQISRQLTTILELNELFHYIVERLQREFKFYYTQIYLVEKETGDLVLMEGSGEVGRQLKERNHRLKAGEGIVGTVASTNEYFLSNRVSDSLNFVPNPLLPRTQAELAVPLRIGARVLGVLDVQSEVSNRFAPEDVSLLQSIANQAAVVTENARLLSETQEVLKQVEHLNRRLTGEGWEEFAGEVAITGYYFKKQPGFFLGPSSDAWLSPMEQAIRERHLVKAKTPGNGHGPKAELAVPLLLRGEVIGVLGIKREEVQDWNEEEVSAVEAVAGQVALALENARLSKEQEKTIIQLKDIDRLKSEFLTSMSHELRTPLNSIIGFADVLLQGIDGDLNDNALADVQAIYNSGQHLLALINDILDLAKIEAGRMELVREAIDIEEVLKSVLSSASSLLKNKPVKLVVEKEKDTPLVYADRLRLNQVLLNLVSNATKFTEEGTITISAEVRDEEPDKLLISVKDTGIGIPPHMLDTVFERFRQVDSSSTRKVGGTGLGLAICRQLVELHEGKIGVSSEVGVGSNFYFTIPLVDSIVGDEILN